MLSIRGLGIRGPGLGHFPIPNPRSPVPLIMHRFFITPDKFTEASVVITDEQAHQIMRVLRLQVGDQLIALDNSGWEYVVEITAVSKKAIIADFVSKQEAQGEPSVDITLYMGLMKRDKFEWVLQKCTEIGVIRFIPVVTQRSLVQDTKMKANKFERWQKIITEAAEQSRRGKVPELCQPMRLPEAFAGVEADLALIPWEEAEGQSLRNVLAGKRPSSVALFIGPEGGFAAEEIELAQEHNIQPITLGKRILRAETAAMVASALLIHEIEEVTA